MAFKLLTIPDIINKHKGTPAIIEGHGPSLEKTRDSVNQYLDNHDLIVFGCNEWWAFENHPKPDYWVRCSVGANGGNLVENKHDIEWFKEGSDNGKIPLFNCDVTDRSSLQSAKENLICPYLPYDIRHFNGKTCLENYNESAGSGEYLNRYFTFFPGCCERRGRLTIQEELQNYTNYSERVSPMTFTVTTQMIQFAIIMGCNPIYIHGMELDYFSGDLYGQLKNNESWQNRWPGFTPGGETWQGWRREYMLKDFNIINESAKNIGTRIINLTHNTWYRTFEEGYIS